MGTSGTSREPAGPPGFKDDYTVIGKPFRRVDGVSKVTGRTQFADDLELPGMLHCRILRSTVAFGRITKLDTAKAEALDGVHAVLTGADTPIPFGILPISQDEHPLAQDVVRHIGDPVAAVAADTEDIAAAACALITVEYERYDTITDATYALTHPEPQIHDYADTGNVHKAVSLRFGDLDAGFAEADHVREDVFFYEGNTHLPMEQHAAVAQADLEGHLTLWSSTQTPHYVHRALAKVLEWPASRIRVIACPNGGGFGGKSDPFAHEMVVAKLAIVTGRPVKIGLSREEVFYCHRGRHPTLMWMRTGVKNDGAITACHVKTLLDGGAYGSYGVASTYYTGALHTVTYGMPRYQFDGARCFTNKPACGPKRGHGTPQPRFGLEVQLDKLAHDVGMDPADIRLNHLQPADALTANYLRIGTMGLRTCIENVIEGSGWRERYGKLPRGTGLGLACSSYITGAGLPIYWNNMPQSAVQLLLDRSGSATVFCGSTEIGQGSDSVIVFAVAEVLGMDPADVRVVAGDTGVTPVDLGSYSSRVTIMSGNAAIQAAERVKELMTPHVAEKLEVPGGRLVWAEGRVFDAEDPARGMSFAEAVVCAETAAGTLGTVGSYTPPPTPGRYKGAGVGPSAAYSYSACVAEVEVDPDTGIVTVPKIWMAHDIGKALNPQLTMGQVEGGVYMGLGEALMEEMLYRGNRFGVHKIPSMLEYKSPTTLEMCDVVTYLVEDPEPNGPFGAKEVGQGPLLPIPPAVANGVFDAVGVRIDQVPITPDKIVRAMQEQAKGREPRFGPKAFPAVDYPEPIVVPTPAEGGDGRAVTGEAKAAERGAGGRREGGKALGVSK